MFMGNTLVKSYSMFLGTDLIYTEYLPQRHISMRLVDVAYIVTSTDEKDAIPSGSFTPCMHCEMYNGGYFLLELFMHKSEYIRKNMYITLMVIGNGLKEIFQLEKKRVENILTELIDKYYSVKIKSAHLATMDRSHTKNRYTSFYDMRKHMKDAETLLQRAYKHKHTINAFESLEKLVQQFKLQVCLFKKQDKHVYEMMYFVIRYFYTYLSALKYGITFYSLHPYAICTQYSPRINDSLVISSGIFTDIHAPNICIRIDTLRPVTFKDNALQQRICHAKYLCFVKLNTSNYGANIVFSQGIKRE